MFGFVGVSSRAEGPHGCVSHCTRGWANTSGLPPLTCRCPWSYLVGAGGSVRDRGGAAVDQGRVRGNRRGPPADERVLGLLVSSSSVVVPSRLVSLSSCLLAVLPSCLLSLSSCLLVFLASRLLAIFGVAHAAAPPEAPPNTLARQWARRGQAISGLINRPPSVESNVRVVLPVGNQGTRGGRSTTRRRG